MAYRINEIFYSLQGEGYHAGSAATFVRFSGCNLRCPFCDTRHEEGVMMETEEILARVRCNPSPLVVITGGEPSLHLDSALVDALHEAGKYIAVETNGTRLLPEGVDWVTLSPKAGMAEGGERIVIPRADEIKVVNVGQPLAPYFDMAQRDEATRMYLQPCYVDDAATYRSHVADTVEKVKRDPRWILSAQLHRYLHID
ncbi:MAG: 7-carboxy-7-deazaguanine synthase QueE [Muribaculaceae bacterium]|nr:7-carboxy-7-deazaguanine synthase QueE [Muribaculaceae bacterium]MDE6448232.1 7-carboxy-7-deazaguanine synthase QueE [Muribaculaceae bacterium]